MLDHETNHLQRILELLPWQFQNLPNWEALLVRFWAPQVQRLEDTMDDLLGQMRLADADGWWLDRWGEELQLPRMDGQADADYRRMLWARAAQLRSNGGPESLVGIASYAVDAPAVARVSEEPPAAATVFFSALDRAFREQIAACLQGARPLGVDLHVVIADADGFGFGSEVPALDPRVAADGRNTGTFFVPVVQWFMDDLEAGYFRLDMMGDTLL